MLYLQHGCHPDHLDHRWPTRATPAPRSPKGCASAKWPKNMRVIVRRRNMAWCHAVAIAAQLLAWIQLIGCHGALAKAEPKTLSYLESMSVCL